mmetsp:Transcript_31575/g.79860  ORF Transcript_31575/g.79860 Transcript_31575/m.79860 type:complete len:320 (+) Transcript_31575:302-1261(+)
MEIPGVSVRVAQGRGRDWTVDESYANYELPGSNNQYRYAYQVAFSPRPISSTTHSTQSDSGKFDMDVAFAAAACRKDLDENLAARPVEVLPLSHLDNYAVLRMQKIENLPDYSENSITYSDSVLNSSPQSSGPAAVGAGSSGLCDDVESLLQLDNGSNALSAWMIDVISSSQNCAPHLDQLVPDSLDFVQRGIAAALAASGDPLPGPTAHRRGTSSILSPEKSCAVDIDSEAPADCQPSTCGPTDSQRAAALARYRNKRHRRKFGQGARYDLRKANADRRPRVHGRFVGRAEAAAIRATAEQAAASSAAAHKASGYWCV